MPFSAPTEHLKDWPDFLKLATSDFKGGWLFRGAMETWDAETSLERVCKSWSIPLQCTPDVERKLLREFKRHPEVRNLVSDPKDTLAWFALMQHHGAPSRLLDWTYSPFVAAYFALDVMLRERSNPDPEKDPKAAIWAINSSWFDRVLSGLLCPSDLDKLEKYKKTRDSESFADLFVNASPRVTFVYLVNPALLNERLSVQQGLFLCPGAVSRSFEDNLASMGNFDRKEDARLIIIHRGLMRESYEGLQHMNVSARSLFPGLDGYAKSLNHRLKFLLDLPVDPPL